MFSREGVGEKFATRYGHQGDIPCVALLVVSVSLGLDARPSFLRGIAPGGDVRVFMKLHGPHISSIGFNPLSARFYEAIMLPVSMSPYGCSAHL